MSEENKFYEIKSEKIRLKAGMNNQDVLFKGTLIDSIEFQHDLNSVDVYSVFIHDQGGFVGAKSYLNLNDGDWSLEHLKVAEKQELIEFFGLTKEAKQLYDKLNIKHEIEI